MQPFLYKVASHLHQHYGEQLQDLCLVLPNKRGALFLKQHFTKVYNKTIWLPEILSAEEFIVRLSGMETADPITLSTELYKAYCQVMGAEADSFEQFVKWSTILLHDFNETDRYLIDARDLFNNLKDIKAIENWSLSVDAETHSPMQQQYLSFMQKMGEIYGVFTRELLQQKKIYQGLAYKLAVERLEKKEWISPYKKLLFCGFNALNKAEERIVQALCALQQAEVLWDGDEYYLSNKQQEAGKFLRKHLQNKIYGAAGFIGKDLLTSTKNIHIIGVPGNMAQALAASQKLSEFIHLGYNLNSTAVVLSDESLLFPVISCLPQEIEDVNITLEYPFHLTNLYDLLEKTFQLHLNKQSSRQKSFYYKDVLKLLHNPCFQLLLSQPAIIQQVIHQLQHNNHTYFRASTLQRYFGESFEEIAFLFAEWSHSSIALQQLSQLVQVLKSAQLKRKPENKQSGMELEFLYQFSLILEQIQTIVHQSPFIQELKSLSIIFYQLLSQSSVPFYGEPLKGMQVMGVLETRTLDFETIILLSVNENILPSGKSVNSFIPFDLKKYFGLPVYADKDAIYAYHFYRLLQQAKNVVLIYNTEADKLGNGEKSRFITQLLHEWKPLNPGITIREEILSGKSSSSPSSSVISVPKTALLLQRLQEKACGEENGGLSPSALNLFRLCSLRFYFHYIAGIRELEKTEDTIETNTLGTIIHLVLEKLYSPYLKKILRAAHIPQMKTQVPLHLKEAYLQHFPESEITSGKNLLAWEVAGIYTDKLLQKDQQYLLSLEKNNTYLNILGLEQQLHAYITITSPDKWQLRVRINGTCDRIDSQPGLLRIIDYKSNVQNTRDSFEFTSYEDLFTQQNQGKMLQLFIYAWLCYKNNLGQAQQLHPCIIPFRSEKQEVYSIMTADKKPFSFTSEILEEFELFLGSFVRDLFNPQKSFEQTTHVNHCQYCPYQTICNR